MDVFRLAEAASTVMVIFNGLWTLMGVPIWYSRFSMLLTQPIVCMSLYQKHASIFLQIDMSSLPDGKHKKMEKYILRKAFDVVDQPYLPEEVLWRQKEQFSDGVGYDWVDGLRDYAEKVSLTPA